jgi:hypothetical protein
MDIGQFAGAKPAKTTSTGHIDQERVLVGRALSLFQLFLHDLVKTSVHANT